MKKKQLSNMIYLKQTSEEQNIFIPRLNEIIIEKPENEDD